MLDRLKALFGGKAQTSATSKPATQPASTTEADLFINEPDDAVLGLLRYGPVLDQSRHVVASRFTLRRSMAARAARGTHAHAYGELTLASLQHPTTRNLLYARPAILQLPESLLTRPQVLELANFKPIIEVQPEEACDADWQNTWLTLREAGFRLALDASNITSQASIALLERAAHADMLRINVDDANPALIKSQAQWLPQHAARAQLMASGIGSEDERLLCEKQGYRWFNGSYLTHRENWGGRDLPPTGLRILDLLNRLRRDAEVHELAEGLKHDPALPYRLLRYLNSAGSGLTQKINSIEQAMVILGRQKLYRWLLMLLYSSGDAPPNADALLETGLIRARFMEIVAGPKVRPDQRDIVFVTGLFSLLDMVLRVPMAKALSAVQLHDAIPAALIKREGPLAPWLNLAIACEGSDAELEAAAAQCGVETQDVLLAWHQAMSWAQLLNQEAH